MQIKKDLTNANIAEYIDNPADDEELHKKWVEGKRRVQAEEQARFAPVALITSASRPSTVTPPPPAANDSPEDDDAIQETGLGVETRTPPASPKPDSSDVNRGKKHAADDQAGEGTPAKRSKTEANDPKSTARGQISGRQTTFKKWLEELKEHDTRPKGLLRWIPEQSSLDKIQEIVQTGYDYTVQLLKELTDADPHDADVVKSIRMKGLEIDDHLKKTYEMVSYA